MSTPRRVSELRRNEYPADTERGAEEFLHGSHAFGGEELLSFPSFPAAEIAS